jgi:cell division protein FtsL
MSFAAEGAERTARARPRVRFTPRAAVLALILTALLLYVTVPLKSYLDQRARLAQLQRQGQILQQQNARLQQEVRQLGDPGYIERYARECLGMVRPGEIGFVVVPANGQPQPPVC